LRRDQRTHLCVTPSTSASEPSKTLFQAFSTSDIGLCFAQNDALFAHLPRSPSLVLSRPCGFVRAIRTKYFTRSFEISPSIRELRRFHSLDFACFTASETRGSITAAPYFQNLSSSIVFSLGSVRGPHAPTSIHKNLCMHTQQIFPKNPCNHLPPKRFRRFSQNCSQHFHSQPETAHLFDTLPPEAILSL